MSDNLLVIACGSGSKWTAPLSTSTPDPCPSGQKMTAVAITFATPSDISQLQAALVANESNFFDGLDSGQLVSAFSFSFAVVIVFYIAGLAVGAVTKIIKGA